MELPRAEMKSDRFFGENLFFQIVTGPNRQEKQKSKKIPKKSKKFCQSKK